MKITVMGASGLVGAPLVTNLQRRGIDLLRFSREIETDTPSSLKVAYRGAQVVMDTGPQIFPLVGIITAID